MLVALALPAVGMKTVDPGAEALPQNLKAIQIYNRIQEAFPGEQAPAIAVVRADSHSARVTGGDRRAGRGPRERGHARADPGRSQRGAHRGEDRDPAGRHRYDEASQDAVARSGRRSSR